MTNDENAIEGEENSRNSNLNKDRLIEASLDAMEKELSIESIDAKIEKIMEIDDCSNSNDNNGSAVPLSSHELLQCATENETTQSELKSADITENIESDLEDHKSEIKESNTPADTVLMETEAVMDIETETLIPKIDKQMNSNALINSDCPKNNYHRGFDDCSTPSILNICTNFPFGNESNANVKQSSNEHTVGKSRPMIEMLSDSDSTDSSEVADTDFKSLPSESELNQTSTPKDSSIDLSIETKSNEQAPISMEMDISLNDNEAAQFSSNGSEQMDKPRKSSAITFFCESLDELKRIDSDSDESLEEI